MQKLILLLGLWIASVSAAPQLLDLEFNHPNRLGDQKGGLPDASVLGDLAFVPHGDGAADFGVAGRLQVDAFPHPRGAFTVEARFRLRAYGSPESNSLSDLVNTSSWDLPGPFFAQGMVLRVGGGATYPALPENTDPAVNANCVGELVMAAQPGAPGYWMEAYTNRCLELNQWVYLVGVWDGEEMRIYLDGRDATDEARTQNGGSQPAFLPEATLTVGARNEGDSDARHLDGEMDFVRVLDGALTDRQILKRYRKTLDGN